MLNVKGNALIIVVKIKDKNEVGVLVSSKDGEGNYNHNFLNCYLSKEVDEKAKKLLVKANKEGKKSVLVDIEGFYSVRKVDDKNAYTNLIINKLEVAKPKLKSPTLKVAESEDPFTI